MKKQINVVAVGAASLSPDFASLDNMMICVSRALCFDESCLAVAAAGQSLFLARKYLLGFSVQYSSYCPTYECTYGPSFQPARQICYRLFVLQCKMLYSITSTPYFVIGVSLSSSLGTLATAS